MATARQLPYLGNAPRRHDRRTEQDLAQLAALADWYAAGQRSWAPLAEVPPYLQDRAFAVADRLGPDASRDEFLAALKNEPRRHRLDARNPNRGKHLRTALCSFQETEEFEDADARLLRKIEALLLPEPDEEVTRGEDEELPAPRPPSKEWCLAAFELRQRIVEEVFALGGSVDWQWWLVRAVRLRVAHTGETAAFVSAAAPEVAAFVRHAEGLLRQTAPKKRCLATPTNEAGARWREAEARATQLFELCGLPHPRSAIEAARNREKRVHAAAIAADAALTELLGAA